MKIIKPWMAVGALVVAGGLLTACGSSGGMKDATSDPDQMKEMIEQGAAGEESIKCVGSDEDLDGQFFFAPEDRFRFDVQEDGDAPSVLSTGDEVFMWVDGEGTGATFAGAEAQLFQQVMIGEMFGDLDSSDMENMDECGIYTGGDGVFSKPGKVDFVTIESDADFAELEDSAPKLVELMFS